MLARPSRAAPPRTAPSRVTRHPAGVLAVVVPGDVVAELRQHDDLGALGGGPVDHPQAGGQVGLDVLGDGELDGGDAHGHGQSPISSTISRLGSHAAHDRERPAGAGPAGRTVEIEAFVGPGPVTVDLEPGRPVRLVGGDRDRAGGVHRPGRGQPGRRRAARDPGPLRVRRHRGGRDPDRGRARRRGAAAAGRPAGRQRAAHGDRRARRPGLVGCARCSAAWPRRSRSSSSPGSCSAPPGSSTTRRPPACSPTTTRPGPGQGLRPRAGRLLHRPPGRRRPRRRARRGARLARRSSSSSRSPALLVAALVLTLREPIRGIGDRLDLMRGGTPVADDEHAVITGETATRSSREARDAARDPHPAGVITGLALLYLGLGGLFYWLPTLPRAHREPRLRRRRRPRRRRRRHRHRDRHHPRQPDRRPRPRQRRRPGGSAPAGRSCCSARSRSPAPCCCPACRVQLTADRAGLRRLRRRHPEPHRRLRRRRARPRRRGMGFALLQFLLTLGGAAGPLLIGVVSDARRLAGPGDARPAAAAVPLPVRAAAHRRTTTRRTRPRALREPLADRWRMTAWPATSGTGSPAGTCA